MWNKHPKFSVSRCLDRFFCSIFFFPDYQLSIRVAWSQHAFVVVETDVNNRCRVTLQLVNTCLYVSLSVEKINTAVLGSSHNTCTLPERHDRAETTSDSQITAVGDRECSSQQQSTVSWPDYSEYVQRVCSAVHKQRRLSGFPADPLAHRNARDRSISRHRETFSFGESGIFQVVE